MIPVDAVIYNNPSLPGLRAIDSSNYNLIKAINYTLVHVNASDFWDELNTPADITYDDISGGNVEAAGYSGYFSFLVGTVGALDMNGDPWYFTGSDYEFGNNTKFDKNISIDGYVNVGKDINPVTTLLSNIGSGAKRWLQLFVQNISAEHIDTYSLTATDKISTKDLEVSGVGNFNDDINILGDTNAENIYVNGTKNFLTMRPQLYAGRIANPATPTFVEYGAYAGYSMPESVPADNEDLFFREHIPGRRMEGSNFTVYMDMGVIDAQKVGNNFTFAFQWKNNNMTSGVLDTTNIQLNVTQSILAGRNSSYSVYRLEFKIDTTSIKNGELFGGHLWRMEGEGTDITGEIMLIDVYITYQVDKVYEILSI
jgi:hypothetical protein